MFFKKHHHAELVPSSGLLFTSKHGATSQLLRRDDRQNIFFKRKFHQNRERFASPLLLGRVETTTLERIHRPAVESPLVTQFQELMTLEKDRNSFRLFKSLGDGNLQVSWQSPSTRSASLS
jgi:hypothetical protein